MASLQQTQELEEGNKSPSLENTFGVAKLREIQELVYQAQKKIKDEDYVPVETDLWPSIKGALGEYADLARTVCMKTISVIGKRLEEQRSERAEPELINLEMLISDLEVGKVKVPEESEKITWLPY